MKRVLLLSILIVVFTATASADFLDMPDNWSTAALQAAVDNRLLSGYDGNIYPDKNLTRAEMATVITRAFGVTETADLSQFTDVTSDKWFYSAMSGAVAMGVFQGDGNKLRPDDDITREEAFTVIARAISLENGDTETLNGFKDKESISSWSSEYISALTEKGYVNGSDGYLNPKKNITRAEFAQLMHNTLQMYVESDISKDVKGNAIVRKAVALRNVTVDGDLIVADSVDGAVRLENVKVKGRVIFRSGNGSYIHGEFGSVLIVSDNVEITASADSVIKSVIVIGKSSQLVRNKKQTSVPSSGENGNTDTDDSGENGNADTDDNGGNENADNEKAPVVEDDGGNWSGWYY